jgi:ATP-binding cassette subfamily B protein
MKKPSSAIFEVRDLGLIRRVRDDEDDEEIQKPLEWSLIRRLFTYATPVKRKLTALTVMTLIRSAQLPAFAWLTSLIINGPISRGDLSALAYGVGGYALLALWTDGMFHFRQRYALEIGETVVNGLRAELFTKTQRQPMSFFHRVKLGRIIGRFTSDVESLRVGIQDVLFVTAVQGGQMLFSAVVMAWSDWVLFLVVLGLAPVLWVINRHFRVKLSHYSRAASDSFSRVTATLAESVNGIRVTQGFVRQETNAGLFRHLLADHSRYSIALARTSAILTPLLELNSQFFVAILLMFGGWRVYHGYMDIGALITFLLLANQFFAPIAIIGNQYNQALVAMAGAERVFKLVDAKPDWEDSAGARALPDPRVGAVSGLEFGVWSSEPRGIAHANPPTPNSKPQAPNSPSGAAVPSGMQVEFRNVSFGYDPARLVLHDVSFTARPGQTIALVGHTGSGKSSIINLAAKFYLPTAGELLIDGHEIRGLTSHSLHRQMGMVQQQNFLFSGTVLENIRVAQPAATEEDVRAAAAARLYGYSGCVAARAAHRRRRARRGAFRRAAPARLLHSRPAGGSAAGDPRRGNELDRRDDRGAAAARIARAAARANELRRGASFEHHSPRGLRAGARPGPRDRTRHPRGIAAPGRALRGALPAVRAGRRTSVSAFHRGSEFNLRDGPRRFPSRKLKIFLCKRRIFPLEVP